MSQIYENWFIQQIYTLSKIISFQTLTRFPPNTQSKQ